MLWAFVLLLLFVLAIIVFSLLANNTRNTGSKSLRGRRLEGRGGILYAVTLFVEMGFVFIRFVVFFFVLAVVLTPLWISCGLLFWIIDGTFDAWLRTVIIINVVATLLVTVFPFFLSILTVMGLRGGATLTRVALGARDSSRREREAVVNALEQIAMHAPEGTVAPSKWFVLDEVTPNAYVVGSTLYVTRELIRSPYLVPVLAHSLGHFNSSDGRLTLALRRMILPPVYLLSLVSGQVAPGTILMDESVRGVSRVAQNSTSAKSKAPQPQAGAVASTSQLGQFLLSGGAFILATTLSLIGGGVGLWVLNPFWAWYWREREYQADLFASLCGQGGSLIEFLEEYQLFDVSSPFFMFSRPYTELRIDKLLEYQEMGLESLVARIDALEERYQSGSISEEEEAELDRLLDLQGELLPALRV